MRRRRGVGKLARRQVPNAARFASNRDHGIGGPLRPASDSSFSKALAQSSNVNWCHDAIVHDIDIVMVFVEI